MGRSGVMYPFQGCRAADHRIAEMKVNIKGVQHNKAELTDSHHCGGTCPPAVVAKDGILPKRLLPSEHHAV